MVSGTEETIRYFDFNRTWVEYEDGFGKLADEFWYGLRTLSCLTGQGGWKMRMEVDINQLANGTNAGLALQAKSSWVGRLQVI